MGLLTISRVALFTAAAALSASTAVAQTTHLIRIAGDRTPIRLHQRGDDIVMRADRGTVLEVIHTEGDRFVHRPGNWYWVLLPRDSWGTQRAGWVSGRQVDGVEWVETKRPELKPVVVESSFSASAPLPTAPVAAATPAPPADAAASARAETAATTDVVLNFEFAKSALTDEARHKLRDAVAQMSPGTSMSLALEGHADAIGSDNFNKRLALERAEAVRRELAEQLRVPADQIGVISYGESQPAAPNTTEEGRAQNRRVVMKVGR
jgi:outer membrane protein OmpA-like peptidoglycan-associated protein